MKYTGTMTIIDDGGMVQYERNLSPDEIIEELIFRGVSGQICRACGCTDDNGCPGGCTWIAPGLCSSHEEKLVPEPAAPTEETVRGGGATSKKKGKGSRR